MFGFLVKQRNTERPLQIHRRRHVNPGLRVLLANGIGNTHIHGNNGNGNGAGPNSNGNGQGNDVLFGYAGNISGGGMFISTANPRPPGTAHRVVIHLPVRIVVVTAEVVWVREFNAASELPPGMGMRFIEIGETDRTAIVEFVDDYAGSRRN